MKEKKKKKWIQRGSRHDPSAEALGRGPAAVIFEADGGHLFRRGGEATRMHVPRLAHVSTDTLTLVTDALCQFLPGV